MTIIQHSGDQVFNGLIWFQTTRLKVTMGGKLVPEDSQPVSLSDFKVRFCIWKLEHSDENIMGMRFAYFLMRLVLHALYLLCWDLHQLNKDTKWYLLVDFNNRYWNLQVDLNLNIQMLSYYMLCYILNVEFHRLTYIKEYWKSQVDFNKNRK